jgi:hypothetical protein
MTLGTPDDRALATRIRRAMSHYTLDRPPERLVSAPRPPSWLRVGAAAAAIASAAILTTVGLAALRQARYPSAP